MRRESPEDRTQQLENRVNRQEIDIALLKQRNADQKWQLDCRNYEWNSWLEEKSFNLKKKILNFFLKIKRKLRSL